MKRARKVEIIEGIERFLSSGRRDESEELISSSPEAYIHYKFLSKHLLKTDFQVTKLQTPNPHQKAIFSSKKSSNKLKTLPDPTNEHV